MDARNGVLVKVVTTALGLGFGAAVLYALVRPQRKSAATAPKHNTTHENMTVVEMTESELRERVRKHVDDTLLGVVHGRNSSQLQQHLTKGLARQVLEHPEVKAVLDALTVGRKAPGALHVVAVTP